MKKDAMSSKRDYEKVLELRPNYQKAVDGLNRVDEYLNGK
jgi:tRNA (Thr-GGU) A37 N-methylase